MKRDLLGAPALLVLALGAAHGCYSAADGEETRLRACKSDGECASLGAGL